MKTKTFNDYEKACIFCDEVDGQVEWCSYKGNQYWTVWFSTPTIIEADNAESEVKK